MDGLSWRIMEPEGEEVPEDLKAADAFGGRDMGWLSQMRPFIREFSQPGDVVLDPFAGLGTTLVASALEGRRGIGLEVEPERVAMTSRRLRELGLPENAPEIRLGDARRLDDYPQEVQLCLTSIPYFGCAWTGTAEGQIYSEKSYAGYLETLDQVLANVVRSLAPGGTAVVMAENLLFGDEHFVPLAWDTGRLLARHLNFCGERILCYRKKGADAQRAHEYALIAQKPVKQLDQDLAGQLLKDLTRANGQFVVIGTQALQMSLPAVLTHPPADLDLLLPNDAEVVGDLARCLVELGFALKSWGKPASLPLNWSRLRNRFYLRAERGEKSGAITVVDLTYECKPLSFAEAWSRAQWVDGIAVAAPEHLARLLAARGKPRDRELYQRIGQSKKTL